jgi:hypothetical protein
MVDAQNNRTTVKLSNQRFNVPGRGQRSASSIRARSGAEGLKNAIHSCPRQDESARQDCNCGHPLRVFPLLPGPDRAIDLAYKRLVGPRSTPPERGPFRFRSRGPRSSTARLPPLHPERHVPTLKIASWNINSVRARLEIVEQFLREEQPDILCLQETKVVDGDFPKAMFHRSATPPDAVRPAHAPRRRDHQPAADAGGRPRSTGRPTARRATVGVRLECGIRLENVYVPAGGDIPDREQNPKFGQKLDFIERMTRWSEECACPTIWSATSTSRRSNATSGATSSS